MFRDFSSTLSPSQLSHIVYWRCWWEDETGEGESWPCPNIQRLKNEIADASYPWLSLTLTGGIALLLFWKRHISCAALRFIGGCLSSCRLPVNDTDICLVWLGCEPSTSCFGLLCMESMRTYLHRTQRSWTRDKQHNQLHEKRLIRCFVMISTQQFVFQLLI